MRVAAFAGWSRSGKTTRIVSLIRHLTARGHRVAAIKHTHHALNDERRGDTERFAEAGAMPVILAGDGEAVRLDARNVHRIAFASPVELLAHCGDVDVVLIEGFKSIDAWPRIDVDDATPTGAEELASILDRIWRFDRT